MESIILSGAHQVCQIVNNMPMEQLWNCQEIISAYVNSLKGQPDNLVQKVVDILKENRKEEKVEAYIYLSSIIINITLESNELEVLERYIINTTELNAGKKHFLFYQIKSLMFCNKSLTTEKQYYLSGNYFGRLYKCIKC